MSTWSRDNQPTAPSSFDQASERCRSAEHVLLNSGWTYNTDDETWRPPAAQRRVVDEIEIRKKDDEIERLKAGIVRLAMATGVEARVIDDIATRQKAGVAKYGTTVSDNPLALSQWLQHAYEECLDQAVYLKRAKEMVEAIWEKEVNES